jgi:hypothetical protein
VKELVVRRVSSVSKNSHWTPSSVSIVGITCKWIKSIGHHNFKLKSWWLQARDFDSDSDTPTRSPSWRAGKWSMMMGDHDALALAQTA